MNKPRIIKKGFNLFDDELSDEEPPKAAPSQSNPRFTGASSSATAASSNATSYAKQEAAPKETSRVAGASSSVTSPSYARAEEPPRGTPRFTGNASPSTMLPPISFAKQEPPKETSRFAGANVTSPAYAKAEESPRGTSRYNGNVSSAITSPTYARQEAFPKEPSRFAGASSSVTSPSYARAEEPPRYNGNASPSTTFPSISFAKQEEPPKRTATFGTAASANATYPAAFSSATYPAVSNAKQGEPSKETSRFAGASSSATYPAVFSSATYLAVSNAKQEEPPKGTPSFANNSSSSTYPAVSKQNELSDSRFTNRASSSKTSPVDSYVKPEESPNGTSRFNNDAATNRRFNPLSHANQEQLPTENSTFTSTAPSNMTSAADASEGIPSEHGTDKLGILLYGMPLKDFSFKLRDGETVSIHKIVLAASSKYFYHQFYEMIGGNIDGVNVDDFDKRIVDLAIKACYQQPFDEQTLGDHIAEQLYKFATKYNMACVLELLPKTLSKHIITEGNVCSIAIRAYETNDSDLRRKCAAFIAALITQGKGVPSGVENLPADFDREIVLAISAKK